MDNLTELPYPGSQKQRRAIREKLRERDGDMCCLIKTGQCLQPSIPMLFGVPHSRDPMSASIEHIKERRRGGKNVMENLALAHMICNQRRSNPGGKEVVRLREREVIVRFIRDVISSGYSACHDERGRCSHGTFLEEECIACYDEHLHAALDAIERGNHLNDTLPIAKDV